MSSTNNAHRAANSVTDFSGGGSTATETRNEKPMNADGPDIGQTQLHDWFLLTLAVICFVSAMTVAVAAGVRWMR